MASATRSKVSIPDEPPSSTPSRAPSRASTRTAATARTSKASLADTLASGGSASASTNDDPAHRGKPVEPANQAVAGSSRLSLETLATHLDTPGREQQLGAVSSMASEAEEGHSHYPPSSTQDERSLRELAPVDRGFQAWMFLTSATLLETIIWGYATSYGVLLDYYLRSDLGRQSGAQTLLPLVGTAATGSMYCLSPFVAALINRYPTIKGRLMWFGLFAACVCLVGASFATTPAQLLVSQGFGFGTGGVLLYYPAMSYLPEHFVARRGMANGAIFAGTGFGGLVFPFILDGLLSRYSLATTLRSVAIGIALTIGVCVPLIRPRLPVGKTSAPRRSKTGSVLGDRAALMNRSLWVFLVANTLQGLAFFIPPLYLPTYTRSLSKTTSATAGSIVLAAMNATSIVSRSGIGVLSDRYRPHLLGAVLLLVGSVSIVALWGGAGATGLPALIAFAAVFGLSAGGWTSIYFAVARECSSDLNGTVAIYGAFSFTRGLGNILCSVIGSKLLLKPFDAPAGSGFGIDDDAYSSLILFCASCCAVSGLIELVLVRFSNPKKRSE